MILLLAALGVAGVAASGPIMAATAAPVLAIAFWRNALGMLIMGVPAAVRRPGDFRRLSRADIKWSVIAASALALHFACFITSLRLTSVAAATALVCLQSGWIALFQLLRGTRTAPKVLLGLTAAVAGVLVITGFDMGSSRDALLGDLVAVAGGALAGLYTMAGGRARQSMSTGTYTTLCYGGCAVLLLAGCLVFDQPIVGFGPAAWLGILGVTLCSQLMGHTIFNFLLARMSPLVVSMIILLEIPGAAILAAVFLHESLPAGVYAGLVLILAGLADVILGERRPRGSPAGPEPAEAPLGADRPPGRA